METVRRAVKQIAYTHPGNWLSTLSAFQLSLIPLLSLASSLYSVAVRLRLQIYHFHIFHKHRLPVSVISVGNLTWGGNGKTPMVEFLARSFAQDGISPLILTRGYGGADEARMLKRQLQGTSARIGVGANRVATAVRFLEQYGYTSSRATFEKLNSEEKTEIQLKTERIGAAILDDGMQHLSVWRDLEIVMVNALMPWGNHRLLPLGPLREPLTALNRADILVIHHADLVQESEIDAISSTIRKANKSVPIFLTKMALIHFFPCQDVSCEVSPQALVNMIVLCISGVGFADSFIQTIERMGPKFLDHIDFNDHHSFRLQATDGDPLDTATTTGDAAASSSGDAAALLQFFRRRGCSCFRDLEMVRARLQALEAKFSSLPIVVVTEKDYDRAPEVLEYLKDYKVLVLCSRLQFVEHRGSTEDRFRKMVREHLSL